MPTDYTKLNQEALATELQVDMDSLADFVLALAERANLSQPLKYTSPVTNTKVTVTPLRGLAGKKC